MYVADVSGLYIDMADTDGIANVPAAVNWTVYVYSTGVRVRSVNIRTRSVRISEWLADGASRSRAVIPPVNKSTIATFGILPRVARTDNFAVNVSPRFADDTRSPFSL